MFLIIHKPTASVVFMFDAAHAAEAMSEMAEVKRHADGAEYVMSVVQGDNGFCDECITSYTDIRVYAIEPDEVALH